MKDNRRSDKLGDIRFLRVRGGTSVLQQMRIDDLVGRLVQRNGSDLHLKVGAPPTVRVRGLLYYLRATRSCGRWTPRSC